MPGPWANEARHESHSSRLSLRQPLWYSYSSMGTQRKNASNRAMARASLPRESRDTLVFCPSCLGHGQLVTEKADGRYATRICRWCEGKGCVDKSVFKLFNRWLRIYQVGRVSGRCKPDQTRR